MITIVLTNRNRDLRIVKNCLDSLKSQTNQEFKCVMVDYGSEEKNIIALEELVRQYSLLKFVSCYVSKQLWNKSRAINIALKQCTTPYFFVGDIDMIFHHNFIAKLYSLKNENQVIYLQVGFLSKLESKLNKSFEDYVIKHKTNKEATGMTLYPTRLLREINGFDEFYHGWGAEDTDVHIRLKNRGVKIQFYDRELLIKHQWHPKKYRSKKSKEPFHSHLEKINHQYIKQITKQEQYLVNKFSEWGAVPEPVDFLDSNNILLLTNQVSEIDALLFGLLDYYKGECIRLEVKVHPKYKSVKNAVKRFLGNKHLLFYDFQTINDMLLGHLIARYRNKYYEYDWNKERKIILLKIAL